MAGVFTDNQPDFSHLAPGETKTFSQYWYPLAGTGPAVAAGLELALGVEVDGGRTTLRFDATRPVGAAEVTVRDRQGRELRRARHHFTPDRRVVLTLDTTEPLAVPVTQDGRTLLARAAPRADADHPPTTEAARQPPAPAAVTTVEELYLIGRHLEQYRHATCSPEPYWWEALSRDPGHAATHVALAARRYREARYSVALEHLTAAVARLTTLNPNPETGAAHYLLGLTLARLGRDDEAYAAFAKATWLDAWVAAGNHQLAVLDDGSTCLAFSTEDVGKIDASEGIALP